MSSTKNLASLAARARKDPALLARARRDPGLRSKLPDSLLTPAQRAARKHNQYLGDLGDINTPLSGQSLVNTAQQMTNSEYDPLLASVGQQEQIVNKSAGLQGDWAKRYYGDLGALLSNVTSAQTGANATSMQTAKDRGQATQDAITGADTDAQKRLADDAAVRGQGLQGSSVADQAARTQVARDAATAASGQDQASTQAAGDASAAFLRGLQGVAGQQGGEYQGQITAAQNAALTKLAQDRTDLNSKKAGTLSSTLLGLRQSEQQNAITAAGLGIKADAAAISADASAGAEGRKYGYTPSEWLKLPASTRTAIVAKSKQKSKSTSGYGPGQVGMNKYGYTYEEWTALSPKEQAAARAGKGKKGAGGSDAYDATHAEVASAQSVVTDAQRAAKQAGIPVDHAHRHQLQALISAGREESSATVNQKTKDGSVSQKVVKQKAISDHDPVFTSVALDVLLDGHVSRYNARRLHARGLTVEDLGYPSYTDYTKKLPRGGAADYPVKGGSGAGA